MSMGFTHVDMHLMGRALKNHKQFTGLSPLPKLDVIVIRGLSSICAVPNPYTSNCFQAQGTYLTS